MKDNLYPMYAVFDGKAFLVNDETFAIFVDTRRAAKEFAERVNDRRDFDGEPVTVVEINCPADIARFSPEEL